jgi:two-component system response regulator LytT
MEYRSTTNRYSVNEHLQAISAGETSTAPKDLAGTGKKNFLVFSRNKYITVPTETIALFCVKFESTLIVRFDRQEYAVNYSLEQIQHLLPDQQFFRLNRQYLVNFNAVKEVEHYFARKLLVNLIIATAEKLLVPKEKARPFLDWLENR